MTIPFNPAAQQGGYRQMPGGYEEAVQAAQAAARGQIPAQLQLQNNQGLPPQMQSQQFGPPVESMSPLDQIRQIQGQLPAQQQFQQPQAGQMQLPPQMQAQPGQRFGDPRLASQQLPQGQYQNLQQLQAAQQAAQMQQQPQQQFQAPAGADLNVRLTGPNVPADLQGRTLGEALAIHNGMRQVHLQLMGQQAAPQQVQQQPQTQQASQAGTQQAAGWDWRDPRAAVGAVVEEKMNGLMQRLEGALAPVVQSSQTNAMQSAVAQARAEIGPAFGQFEPLIMQSLQGADPRYLTNPQTWKVAAERVIGAATLQGARMAQNGQPGLYPQQQVQLGQQPLPNLNSFFSEQPTQGGPGAQGLQLTPQQQWAAQAMGMTQADYAAYYAVTAPRPQQNGGFGR